jgi:transposase IS116/IS110/IS902 family protein
MRFAALDIHCVAVGDVRAEVQLDGVDAQRRRGKLAKAGSAHLRWALVEAAVHAHRATAPDLELYRRSDSGETRPWRG